MELETFSIFWSWGLRTGSQSSIGPIGRMVVGLKMQQGSFWLSQWPPETDLPSSLYQSLNKCFSCREKKDI